MTTAIQKWGNSHGIRIPKVILEDLKWNGTERLAVRTENGKLIIERAEERKNIKELFADFHEEYIPVEIDWGNPVGEEIW
jgi:antitoxin MazE